MAYEKTKPGPLGAARVSENDVQAGKLTNLRDKPTKNEKQVTTWRDRFQVHPAADIFPMLSADELAELGGDIKANGLRSSIVLSADGILLDGRNRLEAMERAGVAVQEWHTRTFGDGDPVAFIVSSNIRRRHLNKQQQADLIVAALKAAEKPRTDCAVSAEPHHGGRGKVNAVKQKAIAEGKKHDIGRRTMEKALAKATPRPKPKTGLRAGPYHREAAA